MDRLKEGNIKFIQFNHLKSVKTDYGIINHPVHIITKDDKISPTAFIPFCDFGGDMSRVGTKIQEFKVPVCNSFYPKILNDQLCYELDLNRFSNKDNLKRELKYGLNLLLDYNEDRQITFDKDKHTTTNKNLTLASSIVEFKQDQQAFIFLDTVGKYFLNDFELNNNINQYFRASGVDWRRRI